MDQTKDLALLSVVNAAVRFPRAESLEEILTNTTVQFSIASTGFGLLQNFEDLLVLRLEILVRAATDAPVVIALYNALGKGIEDFLGRVDGESGAEVDGLEAEGAVDV